MAETAALDVTAYCGGLEDFVSRLAVGPTRDRRNRLVPPAVRDHLGAPVRHRVCTRARASYRAHSLLVAIGAIAITVVVRMLVRNVAIGGAIATVIVLGLLKANTPETAPLFGLAAVLLVAEAWMERRGRLRLPWPRIHEALTIAAIALLAVQAAATR